jgi:hypothetical protein
MKLILTLTLLASMALAAPGIDKAYHVAGAASVTGGIYALERVCRIDHTTAIWTAADGRVSGTAMPLSARCSIAPCGRESSPRPRPGRAPRVRRSPTRTRRALFRAHNVAYTPPANTGQMFQVL